MTTRLASSTAILLIVGVTLAGCSSGTAKKTGIVQGKVAVGGTPVNSGEVVFSVDGMKIPGIIQSDGAYRAVGVPLGSATVAVLPSTAPVAKTKVPTTKDMPGVPGTGGPAVPIPAKYQKSETSGLATTVAAGENTFNIELSK